MKVYNNQSYYGFDNEKVNEYFEGDLTFVNEFCVNGEYEPVAVYRSANPNLEKGHKKYLLLKIEAVNIGFIYQKKKKTLVRGMTEEEIEPFRYQSAIHCLKCDTVIYSKYRHDFHYCKCGSVSVDGGKDYFKVGYRTDDAKYKIITLDLLTNEEK